MLVELVVLSALLYCFLSSILLVVLDLGIGQRYEKVIILFLVAIVALVGSFFVAHGTFYYPPAT